ncbi:flavodoxin FldB [Alteromonas sp. ASW11-36]|uniref:Flavodoxin n=1 Tax=Alteromonas arenosi TaxID=3055817 RepID=A0ABT7SZM3_9ALTE|nr:flavodoxin FldB [Alteromonas sp. ASW11-36]MDM7861454.1 flavodoxin FldB [Alteromonas sp. ASW11-36]
MSEETFKIGLFYGSTTCYTEMAAEKIQQQMNELFGFECVDLYNIKDTGLHQTAEYDVLILGISTWDFGEIQEDWESQWQDIRGLHLEGKIVALYGLGDQMGYADWFQDALGMLHDEVLARQASVIGYWPNDGYEFTASKALTDDQSHFVGLSLDDENQYDLTDVRIAQWCQQLLEELSDA